MLALSSAEQNLDGMYVVIKGLVSIKTLRKCELLERKLVTKLREGSVCRVAKDIHLQYLIRRVRMIRGRSFFLSLNRGTLVLLMNGLFDKVLAKEVRVVQSNGDRGRIRTN